MCWIALTACTQCERCQAVAVAHQQTEHLIESIALNLVDRPTPGTMHTNGEPPYKHPEFCMRLLR